MASLAWTQPGDVLHREAPPLFKATLHMASDRSPPPEEKAGKTTVNLNGDLINFVQTSPGTGFMHKDGGWGYRDILKLILPLIAWPLCWPAQNTWACVFTQELKFIYFFIWIVYFFNRGSVKSFTSPRHVDGPMRKWNETEKRTSKPLACRFTENNQ